MQLWMGGMMPGDRGVISVELHRRRYVATPPGTRRASLRPQDLVIVDSEGAGQEADRSIPAADWLPHKAAYDVVRNMEDVTCTAFAVPPSVMALAAIEPDAYLTFPGLPDLPVLRQAKPSESDISDALKDSHGLVLPGKGVLMTGNELGPTLTRIELVEHAAKIAIITG